MAALFLCGCNSSNRRARLIPPFLKIQSFQGNEVTDFKKIESCNYLQDFLFVLINERFILQA